MIKLIKGSTSIHIAIWLQGFILGQKLNKGTKHADKDIY